MSILKGTDAVAEHRVETADVIKMSIVATLAFELRVWQRSTHGRILFISPPGNII